MGTLNHVRMAVIFDLYGTLVDLRIDEDTPLFWNSLAAGFFGPQESVSGEGLKATFTRLVQKESATTLQGFLLDAVFSRLLEELWVVPTWDHLSRFASEFRKRSAIWALRSLHRQKAQN